MNISKFKTDKAKEQDGVWVEIGEGASILVARLHNPKYQAAVRRLGKPHSRALRLNTAEAGVVEEMTKRAAAEALLLNWKGLTHTVDGKEVEMPFNQQKAYELFCDMPDFYVMVLEAANDVEAYRVDDKEESEGN